MTYIKESNQFIILTKTEKRFCFWFIRYAAGSQVTSQSTGSNR